MTFNWGIKHIIHTELFPYRKNDFAEISKNLIIYLIFKLFVSPECVDSYCKLIMGKMGIMLININILMEANLIFYS